MLVGRSAETEVVDRLLADARGGRSGVLVIRGEPGIGKSALLDYAGGQADGATVLRGTGVEAESELPFAALHQVLRPIFSRIENLPGPQAAALRSAFALSAETVDDRFRVSLGVFSLLADAAEEGPLLCLVDDAHWLDDASVDALLFAARRLEADSIALLFGVRDDERGRFAARGLPELRLSALPASEARDLLASQLGSDASGAAIEWLVERANGNPLALMELPKLLSPEQLGGREPFDETLPSITSLEEAYLERVQGLSPEARTLLLAAAAEGTGQRATMARAAAELGLDPLVLTEAETAGLVSVDSEHVEFRHPLVRSAVYQGAGFVDRERVHRALAAALDGPDDADRRAWHRAAATIGPDADVAQELEETAERAASRSGHSAAAAALRRAAELSVDSESEARRLIAAAEAAWHAGQPERATMLLDWAGPIVSAPFLRARLTQLRGLIELWSGSLPAAGQILIEGAEAIAPLDSRKALEMLFSAASAGAQLGDFALVADAGRRAAALPGSRNDAESLMVELLVGVGSLMEGASPKKVPLVREVIARAGDFDVGQLLVWAAIGAGVVGDDETDDELIRRAESLARRMGSSPGLALVLMVIAQEGPFNGRHGAATEAAEGLRLAREAGLRNPTSVLLAVLAWFAAVSGRDEECAAYAAEALELARPAGHAMAGSTAEWGLALLDLGRGRPDEAIVRLQALRTVVPRVGQRYVVLMSTPDLVEACVRAGHGEQARAALAVLADFAQPGGPPWALALAARCRGLLSQGDEAERAFEEALRLHGEGRRPFERARTELLCGEFLRRERRRTDAREHLRAALETFEQLGAAPWAERARAELRASGETARKRDPSTLSQLTPQELQIAKLVGEGHSNKEVAAYLFLSPRTIDYHLRKVFTKLEITSRAELIRLGIGREREAATVSG